MTDPTRLVSTPESELERALLDAGRSYGASSSVRANTLLALGLTAVATTVAPSAAAASSSLSKAALSKVALALLALGSRCAGLSLLQPHERCAGERRVGRAPQRGRQRFGFAAPVRGGRAGSGSTGSTGRGSTGRGDTRRGRASRSRRTAGIDASSELGQRARRSPRPSRTRHSPRSSQLWTPRALH